MRGLIDPIAQGIIEYERPLITFSCEKMEESIPEGYVHNYELMIQSENQVPIEGTLYSSHSKVTIKQSQIHASATRVIIEVNAFCTAVGDRIQGEFCLVSNGGEHHLPYVFHIESPVMTAGAGELRELADFTALAQRDFEKALRVFVGEAFPKLDFMQESNRKALYLNLLGGNSERRALEEFLVGTGEKKPIILDIEEKEVLFEEAPEAVERSGEIRISASEWGHTFVNCTADMTWIRIKKRQICQEDFQNGQAVCAYSIDPEWLHVGKNYGTISFTAPYQNFSYQIQVNAPMKVRRKRGMDKKGWSNIFVLIMAYENELATDSEVLQALEVRATELMKKYPEDVKLHLLRAWVYLTQRKTNMADKVLDWVQESVEKESIRHPEIYCFMLYLKAMLTREEAAIDNARNQIHHFYQEQRTSFLALLELYMNPLYGDPWNAYMFLKQQFLEGHRSPILHSITCRILEREPQFLTELKRFELITLFYGAKNNLVNEAMAKQILQLPFMELKYFSICYGLLCQLYEKFGGKSLLTAICSLLVRSGKTEEKYRKWYVLGVERNISLTGLCEYYMYSMPEDTREPIPPIILVAYAQKDDLDDRSKRLLYTYIIRNCKKDRQLYEAYEDRMREFAEAQLVQGNVSEKMRFLYHEFLDVNHVDDCLAKALPDLLYARRVTTTLSFARRAIVRYPQMKQEICRPVENRMAWLPVYMKSAAIVFEDEYGNRYADPGYETRQIFIDQRLLDRCFQLYPNHLMLRLTEAMEFKETPIQREEQLYLAMGLLNMTALDASYREELLAEVIEYCYVNHGPATVECDNLLLELDYSCLKEEERIKVTEILIQNNYEKEAYERILVCGYDKISKEQLLYLAAKRIVESIYTQDKRMIQMCQWLLEKGYYNEVTLSYLAKFFQGTNEHMYQLLVKLKEINGECRELPGRLLEQMFFTGDYLHITQVYEWYIQKQNILDVVQRAYYVVKSHCYFCGEDWDQGRLGQFHEQDAALIEEWIHTEERTIHKLPAIYLYALLQYYSSCEILKSSQKELAKVLIQMLCQKGIRLKCMVSLARQISLPYELEGRAIVEVKNHSERAVFNAIRLPGQIEETSEMQRVWPGVFTKALVLFADEIIFCRISFEGKKRGLPEEIRIPGTLCYVSENSRYAQLNEAILLLKEKKYTDLAEKLKEIEIADKRLQLLLPLL